MLFHLMHKNISVAIFDLDNSGNLSKLRRFNLEHSPVGSKMNDMKFHEWWKDRATPKTRKGSKHALR